MCGVIKGEGNKWLMLILSANASRFTVSLWDDNYTGMDNVLTICGERCLNKKLGEFLVKR